MRSMTPLLAALLGLGAPLAFPAPFTACPTEAFLVQDSRARLYGVELSTGYYQLLSNSMATTGKLNAIGFNLHDAHLYAWSYENKTLARIGADLQTVPLPLASQPDSNYFVGDVAVLENAYYMYRKGSSEAHGLWRIGLDSEQADYLVPERIVSGSDLYLNIYDFAFHPDQNMLYSVDGGGRLVAVSPVDGSFQILGNVGQSGTFGAVYFDVDGNLYVSRNSDGVVFQIDLDSPSPTAIKFAQGPASSNNDGARCALASVAPQVASQIDFGDAPESYGTTLDGNGARHSLTGSTLYLGSSVDGESQAYAAPLADETTDEADEDGIGFITELAAGETALVQVDTSGAGKLSAWVDFDRNGSFGPDEQVFADTELQSGSAVLPFDVPVWAEPGASWARFRYTTVSGIGAGGGAPDGEVEDYAVNLFNGGVSTSHYPSASSFVTLAFEDLWPSRGDYDMNDLVMHYRTSISTIDNGTPKLVGISIGGEITAVGATFHSGFAVEIPGLKRRDVDPDDIFFEINGEEQAISPLENAWDDESNAILRITRDVWDHVSTAEGCAFYRTEANCGGSAVQARFSLNIRFRNSVEAGSLGDPLFNPFIFATAGYQRNSIFPTPPGRELEVHLKNHAPSFHANQALLGRADDVSVPNSGITYQTSNGLPWALEIGTEWQHPGEYQDLVQAYPDFIKFVTSGGSTHTQWFLPENAVQEKLYQD